ncbi:TPA: hypothetical protein ACF71V_003403, partial [Legionella pneumophila]
LITEIVEKKVNEEIAHDKATLFTVFGIFASIVTFTSIEIQILKNTCSFEKITGLSLITLSSLLFFIFILDYIGRSWREEVSKQMKFFPWHLFLITSTIFLMGIGLSISGNEQLCVYNNIYARYEKDFNEKQALFEQTVLADIKKLRKKFDANNVQIKELQQKLINQKPPI